MGETFKQYRIYEKGSFDGLVVEDVPKTAPRLGEVLVRIKAVSLNWRDAIIAIGTYPFPERDVVIPGSDGAGT